MKFCLSPENSLVGSPDQGNGGAVSRIWRYVRAEDRDETPCETEQVTLAVSPEDAERLHSGDQFVLGDKAELDFQKASGQSVSAAGNSAAEVGGPKTQIPDDLAEEGYLRQPTTGGHDANDIELHLGGGFGGGLFGWRRRSR